jgi:hypothetical protein
MFPVIETKAVVIQKAITETRWVIQRIRDLPNDLRLEVVFCAESNPNMQAVVEVFVGEDYVHDWTDEMVIAAVEKELANPAVRFS